MPKYRVLISRERRIVEHAVVFVVSNEAYVDREARKLGAHWFEDTNKIVSVEVCHKQEVEP